MHKATLILASGATALGSVICVLFSDLAIRTGTPLVLFSPLADFLSGPT